MMGRAEEQRKLANLADNLVDDILDTPDEDIIKEVSEDGGDPKQVADQIRAQLYNRAIL